MPTYAYKCQDCNHETEIFQNMSDKKISQCPMCNGKGFERLFGVGAGVSFKGDGFWQTDYKTKDHTSKADKSCGSQCGCHPS